MIITRKVRLGCSDLKKLFGWQNMVRSGANMVMTTHYIMDNLQNMVFLEDGTKLRLADIKKDPDGILTCSKQNSTYQILSKYYKGEMPSGILTSLNQKVQSSYSKASTKIKKGEQSLPSYRKNIPIPFQVSLMRDFRMDEEDKKYKFTIGGIEFTIFFGKDLSRNNVIFERYFAGEYKLCDSTIEIKDQSVEGKKKYEIYLLAVFDIPQKQVNIDSEKVAEVELDVNSPMVVRIGSKEIKIGDSEEFLHRRLAIQGAMRRLQSNLQYAQGGKGREKKLKALQRYEKAEYNYITTRIHTYTRKLIDICVEKNCGKIVLVNQKAKEQEAKLDEKYVLRNWSYYGMKEKIDYKAALCGIKVEEN